MDGSGEGALRELDARLEEAGPQTVAAFFCEPISGAARPAFATPDKFWRGLEERRASHGILVCFGEAGTGVGRTGTWFAYQPAPIWPGIVSVGQGLGASIGLLRVLRCKQCVFVSM